MEFRRLGSTGLQVSAVALGAGNLGGRVDEATSIQILDQALDLGVNLLDINNSARPLQEELIGKALKGRRHSVVMLIRFALRLGEGPNLFGGSRRHIMDCVETSLKRLQTEYIDVLQFGARDRDTPIEETLRALDDLVRQGKVRYTGCSNFDAWHMCEAHWTATHYNLNRFACASNQYHLFRRDLEKDLLPLCRAYGIAFLPYRPLAGGLLTGKYRRGQPIPPGNPLASIWNMRPLLNDSNFERVEALERLALDAGHTMTDLAIAWLLAQPSVPSVICGATNPGQVQESVRGVTWKLTIEELRMVDSIVPPPALAIEDVAGYRPPSG